MILDVLRKEEGFSEKPYYCTEGYPTIGIGKRIGAKGEPLECFQFTCPLSVAEAWLGIETKELFHYYMQLDWFVPLTYERQAIIISMAYQMGVQGLSKFTNMIQALREENYVWAASEALDSRWARQTYDRAIRHAYTLESGNLGEYYD